MKYRLSQILLITILLSSISVGAQMPSFQWASPRIATNSKSNKCNGLVIDKSGNTYYTGYFSDYHMLCENVGLHSGTDFDTYFLVKYKPSGEPIWGYVPPKSSLGFSEGAAVGADASCNTYVAGTFNNNVFSGVDNHFIAKVDSTGKMIWSRYSSGNVKTISQCIHTDQQGNSLVAGYFTGIFIGDSVNFGNIALKKRDAYNLFISKYDSAGNVLWAKLVASGYQLNISDMACDESNNIYVSGFYRDTLTFNNSVGLKKRNRGSFLAKFDSLGNYIWGKAPADNNENDVTGMALDDHSNIYLTGNFRDILTIGPYVFKSKGWDDLYVAKFDSSGTTIWAKSEGDNSYGGASGICLDNDGHMYVAGYFSSKVFRFGKSIMKNIGGAGDVMILKYDTSGNQIWGKSLGGTGNEELYDISSDSNDRIYMCGYFKGCYINVDTTKITNYTNGYSYGYSNYFLARLNGNGGSCLYQAYDTLKAIDTITVNTSVYIQDTVYIKQYDTLYIAVSDTLYMMEQIPQLNPPNNIAVLKFYYDNNKKQLVINVNDSSKLNGYTLKMTDSTNAQIFSSIVTKNNYAIDIKLFAIQGTYFVYLYDSNMNLIDIKKIIIIL